MQQLKKQQGNCLLKRHTRRSEFLQYYEGFVLVEEGTLPPRLLDAGKPEMLQQLLICSVLWGKSLSHLHSPVWNTKHSTNVTKLPASPADTHSEQGCSGAASAARAPAGITLEKTQPRRVHAALLQTSGKQ